jgi:hypothetical protein
VGVDHAGQQRAALQANGVGHCIALSDPNDVSRTVADERSIGLKASV